MEVEPPRQGRAATPIPVPLGEIFSIAAERERGGRLDDAERLLSHILKELPTQPDALHLQGIVTFRKGRHLEALDLMQKAIEHGVDTPLYLRNICEVYRTLGRLDEALATAKRAEALAPSDPLCLHNLAIIHYERLEIDECLDCARRALAIDPSLPGAHFERAEALLLRGEMAEGWEEYEWRFRIAGAAPLMPPTDKPQWDGTPFSDRTLLLIADQGFGDVIQFSRYIPWVAGRCPNLAMACSAEVAPLLRQIHPGLKIFQRWEQAPPYAAFSALSGLPRLHATRLDTVPAPIPYLRSDPVRKAAWAERLSQVAPRGYRRVGVVWAGRPTHNNDRNRSATLAAFAPIAALRGIVLISLQKGPAAAQAGGYFGRAPLVNIGAEIHDYNDTMAILDNLDLLVTVDTSVGHLAGAMGRPAWIMIARAPDWRWLLGRPDSPWYPTVRLFRQNEHRKWDKVTSEVAQALESEPQAAQIADLPKRRRAR
jgi:hypothetical protein